MITPTAEQIAALDAFATGDDLIIEAGAGAGKTSTLNLLAAAASNRRGQYLAFSRALVDDARGAFPSHVNVSTVHSLAFRVMGSRFSHRLNGPRMRSEELAARLSIHPMTIRVGDHEKILPAAYLAGHVMRALTVFCQSADPAPTERHFPYVQGIDLPEQDGAQGWENNRAVRRALMAALARAWADVQTAGGSLPFKHEHYLKMWERSGPRIPVDFLLFDEAQDVSPVMASIVGQQTHAQRVYVGDSSQAIFGFTGAIDAMAQLRAAGGARVATLTQSFRFGDAIASTANRVLSELPTGMRIRGTPTIPSVVGDVAEPAAILCRTNATAVQTLMNAAEDGRRGHLVGGGGEVVAFARGAQELQQRGHTSHQDLACFASWGQVIEYVHRDAQGDDLKLLVNLVDRFGAETIARALETMPREADADLVISTAHRSKGREWASVRLASDFPADQPGGDGEDEPSEDELRLLYVAATRARIELDASAVAWIAGEQPKSTQLSLDLEDEAA